MQTIFPKEKIQTIGDLIEFLEQFPKTSIVMVNAMPFDGGLNFHHAVEYSFHGQKFIELNCDSAVGEKQ